MTKVLVQVLVDVPQVAIDHFSKHNTKGTDEEVAQDLANSSIECHSEYPYSMRVVTQ